MSYVVHMPSLLAPYIHTPRAEVLLIDGDAIEDGIYFRVVALGIRD
jgi:hypothetical protein